MSTHLATCPRCQAAMYNLYLRLTEQPAPPATNCESCQADLAVYIDTLLSAGAAAAAREFPQVWWHIWQCPDCAETFELTLTLIDAELRGELTPLASLFKAEEPLHRILRMISVRPEIVAHLFAARQILGIAYGVTEEIIVSEEIDEDYTFQISIQQNQGADWAVVARVKPAISAIAMFTIGNLVCRVPFDETGRAIIHGLRADDLQNTDTGITVAIEALD